MNPKHKAVCNLVLAVCWLTTPLVAARAEDNVVEYEVAMETLGKYATQVTEAKTKLVIVYTSAVANFETTIQQASAEEAKADVAGAVLKTAWKTAQGMATAGIKSATGIDIAPLVELYEAVDAEIDRAAAASTSLKAGDWIKKLRSSIVDEYAKDNSGAFLQDLKDYYASLETAEEKFDWITSVQVELEALKEFRAPATGTVELVLYESWLNENFTHCKGDPDSDYGSTEVTGLVRIMFDEDDGDQVLESVCVVAPLRAKIQGGLESVMSGGVLGLKVYKQVCFEGDTVTGMGTTYYCACIGRDNGFHNRMFLPEWQEYLESGSWKDSVSGFYNCS